MSINIQNHIYSANNIQSDRQRERAERFVNKSDREISHMAHRAYNISHYEKNKKFSSNLDKAIVSLPFVAAASSLLMGKGVKNAAKNSAMWGTILVAPAIVQGLGKALSKPDSNGNKHDKTPLGVSFGLSLAGMFAGQAGIQKLSESKKVNQLADTIIDGVKNTYNNVKKEIKFPENISNKIADIKGKIKTPEIIKPAVEFIKGNALINDIKDVSFNVVKKGIKNAPAIVATGAFVAMIGHAIKQGSEISSTKNHIKESQLDTARVLIDSYKQENQALKDA